MLLAAIDESHNGAYDFLYLPIDFKVCLDFHELIFSSFYMKSELIASVFSLFQNKCNVGYAFINMVSPSHIISFYEVCIIVVNLAFKIYVVNDLSNGKNCRCSTARSGRSLTVKRLLP